MRVSEAQRKVLAILKKRKATRPCDIPCSMATISSLEKKGLIEATKEWAAAYINPKYYNIARWYDLTEAGRKFLKGV